MKPAPVLWLITPCYNEQAVLSQTFDTLSQLMTDMSHSNLISAASKIVVIDDGSTDQTWRMIEERCEVDQMFCGIKLSRNFGQQKALLAGMEYAYGKCDCIISIDADLQDDLNVLQDFVKNFKLGYHIVYGVHDGRDTDTWFKRITAKLFYLLTRCLGAEMVENHSECRLLSSDALRALLEHRENNIFLRSIIPQLGFESTVVRYAIRKRPAGETKYSVSKLLRLAIDGIVSSSEKPLRLIPLAGLLCACAGIAGVPYNGWVSSGLQLICLGIACEYLGKVSVDIKRRPRYIISKIIGGDSA